MDNYKIQQNSSHSSRIQKLASFAQPCRHPVTYHPKAPPFNITVVLQSSNGTVTISSMQRNLKLLPVLAACALSLSSCSTSSNAKDIKAVADTPSTLVVAVSKVATADLTREIVLTGEFRPYQSVEISAKVAGYLKSISVDVGDRVQAGQRWRCSRCRS